MKYDVVALGDDSFEFDMLARVVARGFLKI
jgi:hypothetical protein